MTRGDIQAFLFAQGLDPATLAMAGTGFGALLLVLGLAGMMGGKDPVLRRIEATGRRRANASDNGLLQPVAADPKGLMKTLVPADRAERTRVQRQLSQAGLTGPHALRNYYLMRVLLGIVLPGLLLGATALVRAGLITLPDPLTERIVGLSRLSLLQVLAVLVGIGFFGPAYWLRSRSGARRQAIEYAFPNTLDLVQISVEAGLGFDAAMIRVANEIAHVAPEISAEFLAAQREIQAGRNRDKALLDMATRMQVEEVTSFVNVILQSARFGTDISDVLRTYSQEMRMHRELKAQEMANKLPVKMSGVLASLMLPALVLMTVGPVALRFIRFMAG